MRDKRKFYVYKWYNIDTNEIFYIGKGCGNRSKQINRRNKIFKEYYSSHNCQSEIVKYFDDEAAAFAYEHELILKYKKEGQAIANLDDGGKGGLSFVWNKEMREYKSKYNPMKDPLQRKRMSENNPMYNPEIAKKVSETKSKSIVINNKEYKNANEVADKFNVGKNTVYAWCKRGYTTDGLPCKYADEEQKEIPFIKTLGRNVTNIKSVIIDGIYYPTVKSGAEAIGGNSSNLIRAIKANRSYKGHTCSYANQQPS